MRLPLLISAIILAQSVRLSASMKRHMSVERRGRSLAAAMAMAAPIKTFMARIRPLSSQWWLLSPMSMHMVKPASMAT